MPGCYLQAAGTDFDPDVFLSTSSLEAYRVWHVGDSRAPVGPRSSLILEYAGFRCDVSNVDGDLKGQIEDAIVFLTNHHDDLVSLVNDPTVEDRRLDFGFDCRLNNTDVVVQGEWLPVDFLQLVAELRIGVALSLYPSFEVD